MADQSVEAHRHTYDRIVTAAERAHGIAPTTFRTWAKSGRLRAFIGPRGRFQAWESDVIKAIEAEPVVPTGAE